MVRAGLLVVEVDEKRGGEITRARHGNHDVLASYDWIAPVGASRNVTYGDPRLDWLSEYRGGWQLLVPNAGAACEVAGVPLPFHGEWSRTRVTVTGRDAHGVLMTAGTRLPLTIRREVRVATGPDRVLVHTVVVNACADSVPFTWGEHPAFSVGPGDEVDFPSADVDDADAIGVGRWPTSANGRDLARLGPADCRESLHFLVGFSQGWAAIRRRHLGVALAWDVKGLSLRLAVAGDRQQSVPLLRAGVDSRDRTCGELARRRPRRGDRARSGAGPGTGPATVDHRRADPLRTRRTIRRGRLDRWRGPVRIMIPRSFDATRF